MSEKIHNVLAGRGKCGEGNQCEARHDRPCTRDGSNEEVRGGEEESGLQFTVLS